MSKASKRPPSFAEQAQEILSVPVAVEVNALGGYGQRGEVIYRAHPPGCPSVLVDSQAGATATFMSNGSVEFLINGPEGMEIPVLEGSFDPVEKREIGVPSSNVWIGLGTGRGRRAASLVNPGTNVRLAARSVRIVKLGDPNRAMWYCASFQGGAGVSFTTAVRYAMVRTKAGPALAREVYVKNTGRRKLNADLWTYFNLHGTQQFVYNKEIWYDCGLPLNGRETVVSATVPYSEILQIKRVASAVGNAVPAGATCDYSTFVGDTAVSAFMPQAVRTGEFLPGGAGAKMNRFTTATIAANKFALSLPRGKVATVQQSLLYVTDGKLIERFRKSASSKVPTCVELAKSFRKAGRELVARTPGPAEVSRLATVADEASAAPYFELQLPAQRAVAEYANSVWTGVKELYENCRAHGAKLANGIELGTRDRAQDMWPKIKEDPGRVRDDLIHVFSFMYVTQAKAPRGAKRLSLAQKLHGMFPRQYPNLWLDRSQEVYNDNRPYTDSPLWLINSLNMYIRETGDTSILGEIVKTIRLTDPDNPVKSGIVGNEDSYAIVEVVFEIFANFARSVTDSPYGMAQILYGDWCDPIDMFGVSVVGDASTRGRGRGVQVRLTAHLFECLVQMIDLCRAKPVARLVARHKLGKRLATLEKLAGDIRKNVVKYAWEDASKGCLPGFIDVIHEFNTDGSRPKYRKGEIGYTLGSMKGRDFDGIRRRELASQSYCLAMLCTERDYLPPVPGAKEMIAKVLATTDRLFFDPKLGLVMFSAAMANSEKTCRLVGRMGVLPAGTAENGEYHHCQVFMHRVRLGLPGQASTVWRQFKPIMSAMRDASLCGPFETPCTSYTSDKKDPHFAKGMYFGLSGSVDWIVEIFQKVAGVELNLHDPALPDVRVRPNLPKEIRDTLTFRRIIHCRTDGGYRKVPLTVHVRQTGCGGRLKETIIKVNGKRADGAEVADLKNTRRVKIEIVKVYGA